MFNNFKFGSGHALVGIGLGAGAVSMGLNTVHSFHIALWAAPIVILSETARIAIPFIAAHRGWTGHLKATFGAVVALCLLTSTAFLADSFGNLLRQRGQAENVQAQKAAKIAELKTDIAAVAEKLSSKALTDMAAKEETRKDKPGCGTTCLNYKERAGKAERREALEVELKNMTVETQTAALVEVSGLGAMLGYVTGWGTELGSALSMILFGGAVLYCLDLLVYLIIPGSRYCREDRANAKLAQFGPLEIKTVKATVDGKVKISKQDAYRKVCATLLETADGSILTSDRALARVLGVSKSTFSAWMKEWEAKGELLSVTKNRHQKLVSLPSKVA